MTHPTWPTTLPRPQRASYQAGSGESRLMTDPDAGLPTVRSRYSLVVNPVAMRITVDRNGLAEFDNFYSVTLANGAKPFLMTDPATDGWALLDDQGNALLDEADNPIQLSETWIVYFGRDLPVRTSTGGNEFRVSFGILVMPS